MTARLDKLGRAVIRSAPRIQTRRKNRSIDGAPWLSLSESSTAHGTGRGPFCRSAVLNGTIPSSIRIRVAVPLLGAGSARLLTDDSRQIRRDRDPTEVISSRLPGGTRNLAVPAAPLRGVCATNNNSSNASCPGNSISQRQCRHRALRRRFLGTKAVDKALPKASCAHR